MSQDTIPQVRESFSIAICSVTDYDELVADLYLGRDHSVGMITQDKGVDDMEIEIFAPVGNLGSWKLHLGDFLKALHLAKATLSKMHALPAEVTQSKISLG